MNAFDVFSQIQSSYLYNFFCRLRCDFCRKFLHVYFRVLLICSPAIYDLQIRDKSVDRLDFTQHSLRSTCKSDRHNIGREKVPPREHQRDGQRECPLETVRNWQAQTYSTVRWVVIQLSFVFLNSFGLCGLLFVFCKFVFAKKKIRNCNLLIIDLIKQDCE